MTTPAKGRTKPTGTSEAVAETATPGPQELAAELIHTFVAWRREKLRMETGPPGIVRSGPASMRAAAFEPVLVLLDEFASWIEHGQPRPGTLLSEDDKARWRWVAEQGLNVPPDIAAQL